MERSSSWLWRKILLSWFSLTITILATSTNLAAAEILVRRENFARGLLQGSLTGSLLLSPLSPQPQKASSSSYFSQSSSSSSSSSSSGGLIKEVTNNGLKPSSGVTPYTKSVVLNLPFGGSIGFSGSLQVGPVTQWYHAKTEKSPTSASQFGNIIPPINSTIVKSAIDKVAAAPVLQNFENEDYTLSFISDNAIPEDSFAPKVIDKRFAAFSFHSLPSHSSVHSHIPEHFHSHIPSPGSHFHTHISSPGSHFHSHIPSPGTNFHSQSYQFSSSGPNFQSHSSNFAGPGAPFQHNHASFIQPSIPEPFLHHHSGPFFHHQQSAPASFSFSSSSSSSSSVREPPLLVATEQVVQNSGPILSQNSGSTFPQNSGTVLPNEKSGVMTESSVSDMSVSLGGTASGADQNGIVGSASSPSGSISSPITPSASSSAAALDKNKEQELIDNVFGANPGAGSGEEDVSGVGKLDVRFGNRKFRNRAG